MDRGAKTQRSARARAKGSSAAPEASKQASRKGEHHTNRPATTCTACGIKPESLVCGKKKIATGLPLAQALVINGLRAHGMGPNSANVFLVLVSRRRNVAEELEAVSASALQHLHLGLVPPVKVRYVRTFEATCSLLSPSAIKWPCSRRRRPLADFIGLKGPDLIRSGVSGLPASPVRDRMQQTTLAAGSWLLAAPQSPWTWREAIMEVPVRPLCAPDDGWFLHCESCEVTSGVCLSVVSQQYGPLFPHLPGTALYAGQPCHCKSPRYLGLLAGSRGGLLLVPPRNLQVSKLHASLHLTITSSPGGLPRCVWNFRSPDPANRTRLCHAAPRIGAGAVMGQPIDRLYALLQKRQFRRR